MRIIISPAKRMLVDTDSFAIDALPLFLEQTEQVKEVLQNMTPEELAHVWRCNSRIGALNMERLDSMDLYHGLTPAILAYDGVQYRYMAPGVMETAHYDYLREHLRILSGFYGMLRPFDGVVPHRLEMQSRLSVEGCRDLYQFWGERLAGQLAAETDLVVNLASKEYSRAVKPYLPESVRLLTCTLGEWKNGKVVEQATMCKMGRGQMVRWLAENNVTDRADIRAFDQLGYRFRPELSTEDRDVFLRIPENRP